MEATTQQVLRPHAEESFGHELKALQEADQHIRPQNWQLSPRAVVTYLMGGTLEDGTLISQKYYGDRRLMEVAVATLATDRALLLTGIPGTAKTWVSEHLAAAISFDSTLLIQGSAGLGEEALRYGWNYAMLLSKGPSEHAIVASPVMQAMKDGKIARLEELTRIPSDVQDTLITILSEKTLPVPELNTEVQAVHGFNLIATANDRDRGVNELSAALRRRFNTVVLPLPGSLEEEVNIVRIRVEQLGKRLEIPFIEPPLEEVRQLITIFRELRAGQTIDGKQKLKIPGSTLSTAEAISVLNSALALAAHFGDGHIQVADIAAGVIGAVIKDPTRDATIWEEYLETVIQSRKGWESLYEAFQHFSKLPGGEE
jgi:MoxR-like ATPase